MTKTTERVVGLVAVIVGWLDTLSAFRQTLRNPLEFPLRRS